MSEILWLIKIYALQLAKFMNIMVVKIENLYYHKLNVINIFVIKMHCFSVPSWEKKG